jgi:uncharacterized phage protein (TIGR02216 family)
MPNARRGEVEATIGGRRYTLCLTLGSLAELEHAFGVDDLASLAARFGAGGLRAEDLIRLLGAGLRGGGHPLSDNDVRALPLAGALGETADAVSALLDATFGAAKPSSAAGRVTASEPRPFPWAEVLHFAFRILRWPPETVWRATPREIAAALTPLGSTIPMAGSDFAALMRAFPDSVATPPPNREHPHGQHRPG